MSSVLITMLWLQLLNCFEMKSIFTFSFEVKCEGRRGLSQNYGFPSLKYKQQKLQRSHQSMYGKGKRIWQISSGKFFLH